MLTNLVTMNHRPEEIGMFVCQISFGCETSQRTIACFQNIISTMGKCGLGYVPLRIVPPILCKPLLPFDCLSVFNYFA